MAVAKPLPEEPPIRIVASARRRRTVSARLVGGVLEVRVPAWMGAGERERWARQMAERVMRQRRRARPTDAGLEQRARELNRLYFGGRLRWASIAFAEQQSRWGSCTFTAGVIRISSRAASLPRFVIDYLLVHELAHLEVPGHGLRFWTLVNAYPLTERARGYLLALDHAAHATHAGEPEDF